MKTQKLIPDHVKVLTTEHVPPYLISMGDDGILYSFVTNELEETVERSKALVQAIGKLTNYKKVPMLVMFHKFTIPPKDNRDFWAKKDSCPYTSAEAFIIHSAALKVISNFYLDLEKPQRETKMFTKVEDARKWLLTFL